MTTRNAKHMKFNLAEMLAEIKEDDQQAAAKDTLASQADIRSMFKKKKKKKRTRKDNAGHQQQS